MKSRAVCVFVLWLSCFLVAFTARADAVRSRDVLLVVAADARGGAELELVVRELLDRLAVTLEVSRVDHIDIREIASPPTASHEWLARVWIDLREPGRATLYLYDTAHDRLFVRQVGRAPGSEELAREELGHILETCAEGLLSGANVGLPRGDVAPLLAPQKDEPRATPTSEPPPPFRFGALYEIGGFSSQTRVTHGPAVSMALRVPIAGVASGAWLTAQYRWPMEASGSAVGARWKSVALRALATLELESNATTSWRLGVGGGVDVVRVEPESSDARFLLEPATTLAFAVARGSAGVHLRVARWASLAVTAAVDIDPSGASYVVAARAGEQVVLRPWVVRPAVLLGLDFP